MSGEESLRTLTHDVRFSTLLTKNKSCRVDDSGCSEGQDTERVDPEASEHIQTLEGIRFDGVERSDIRVEW